MIDDVVLNWEGPFSYHDFLLKQEELRNLYGCAGVYLHTVSFPNGEERLSYVGKATESTTLFLRQQQHYASLIGGLYNLPEEFSRSNQIWIPDWRKPETVKVMTDVTKFHSLVGDCYAYSQKIKVFLARKEWDHPVDVVERNLLYDLRPFGTIRGTRTQTKNPLSIVHKNASWRSNYIASQVRSHCRFI